MAVIKDEGHEETEQVLVELEERIKEEYEQAEKEIQEKLGKYLKDFERKDAKKREKLENGEITEEEYNNWRLGQIAIGERWAEMRDTLAEDLTNVADKAKSITNGYMPEVYAINHNYGMYQVEKASLVDTSFTLYDRQTVERLIEDGHELYHAPGKKTSKAIAEGKQKAWDKKQVQSVMTQAILQGESIPKMAKRLATAVGDSDMKAAVRNARTMATGAQNAGRTDAYKRAESMGIKLEQEWLATLDGRTRHEHRLLDGQRVKVGDKFKVDGYELEYPGDPSAPGHLVYNCRCTLVPVLEGFEVDSTDLSQRNTKNLGDMTYEEWKNEKYYEQAEKEINAGGHISDRTVDMIWGGVIERETLMSRVTGTSKDMCKVYLDAIEGWSGGAYRNVRRYQQGELKSGIAYEMGKSYSEFIEEFIDKSPKWSGGITYRGVGLTENEFLVLKNTVGSGSLYNMKGTASWSSDEDTALDFGKDKDVQIIFRCKTQNLGTTIMPYTDTTPYEYEVTVSKNANYKVVKISKKSAGVYVCDIEEIKNGFSKIKE